MTEKLLTFPSPTPTPPPPPSPTSPDPGDGVNRSKFNVISSTASTQPNTTKDHLYRDTMRGSRNFLSGGGGGRGGGSRLLNLFYSLYTEEVQWVLLHIFQEGVQLFPGRGGPNANFYRNPYNYNL